MSSEVELVNEDSKRDELFRHIRRLHYKNKDDYIGSHRMNYYLERVMVQVRSGSSNPRVALLGPNEGSSTRDLLEVNDQNGMPQLDSLLVDLRNEVRDMSLQRAIAAVTLVGGHCARLDGNSVASAAVWEWSLEKSGENWSPAKLAPLRLFECFKELANSSAEQSSAKIFTMAEEICGESRKQLRIQDNDLQKETDEGSELYAYRWLVTQLTSMLTSLPAASLRQTALRGAESEQRGRIHTYGEQWLRQIDSWFPCVPDDAVLHQSRARILLALGKLREARLEIERALNCAKPHMLQSIEASRQMQLAIDLEDLSRTDIVKEISEEAKMGIQEEGNRLKAALSHDLQLSANEERAKTTEEIKDALLRVVEILGIFLGVAGVAVTSIGGILVEGSIWTKALVWGMGYGTLLSLFVLLRAIAWWPVRRRRSTEEISIQRAVESAVAKAVQQAAMDVAESLSVREATEEAMVRLKVAEAADVSRPLRAVTRSESPTG